MSDETDYVAYWQPPFHKLAEDEEPEPMEEQKPILEDKETERFTNDNDELFIFFDNEEEAYAASEEGLIVTEIEIEDRSTVSVEDLSSDTIIDA